MVRDVFMIYGTPNKSRHLVLRGFVILHDENVTLKKSGILRRWVMICMLLWDPK